MLFVDHPWFVGEQNVYFVELLQFQRRKFEGQSRFEPASDLGTRTGRKTRFEFGNVSGYQLGATVTSGGLKGQTKTLF